jgi:GAF domain-containing protein
VLEDYAPPRFSDVLERGLAGWVVENRQAALVTNTLDDPRWLARLWEWEGEIPRSAISVPLLANDHVVGVLTLVNSQVGKYTEEDLSLLTSISTFVSLVNYAV